MSSTAVILSSKEIKFDYPERNNQEFILDVEEFEIFSGEVHALVGANGSGKSTFLKVLAGLLKPGHGTVELDGKDISSYSDLDRARILAYLPQRIQVKAGMSVLEAVLTGRHPWKSGLGLADQHDLEIATEAMEQMNLVHLAQRKVGELSGGEFQRAWLASVLAQQPKVILLDEPTHWLDIHHQVECLQLLRNQAARNIAILLSTHDLNMAGQFSDRMTLLKAGKVIKSGNPDEVLNEQILTSSYGFGLRVIQPTGLKGNFIVPLVEDPKRIPNESSLSDKQICSKVHPDSTSPLSPSKYISILIGLFLLLVGAIVVCPSFGAEKIDLWSAISELSSHGSLSPSAEILKIRFPRVVMAALAGMALAGTGAVFQSLLRNPLAEPFTLGTASASALGAVVAISFPAWSFTLGPVSGIQAMAFAAAVLNTSFLWIAGRKSLGQGNLTALLLMGITMGLICSSIILLVRFLASPLTVRTLDQWMVGGIDITSWKEILPALPFVLPGLSLILLFMRDLAQVELGSDIAVSRGIRIESVQRSILLGGCLATAGVVSIVGPVGFIGLIVPHFVRKIVGSDLRIVAPCSILGGGICLVLLDTIARSISILGRGAELPVGVISSFVGGFIFLTLFLSRSKQSFGQL